jgi:hypothetical protein
MLLYLSWSYFKDVLKIFQKISVVIQDVYNIDEYNVYMIWLLYDYKKA